MSDTPKPAGNGTPRRIVMDSMDFKEIPTFRTRDERAIKAAKELLERLGGSKLPASAPPKEIRLKITMRDDAEFGNFMNGETHPAVASFDKLALRLMWSQLGCREDGKRVPKLGMKEASQLQLERMGREVLEIEVGPVGPNNEATARATVENGVVSKITITSSSKLQSLETKEFFRVPKTIEILLP